jgi:hypothetical protein
MSRLEGVNKISWFHTRKHNAMPQTKKKLTVAHLAKKISMEPDNMKFAVNVNTAQMLKAPSEQTVKTTKLARILDILHRPISVKKNFPAKRSCFPHRVIYGTFFAESITSRDLTSVSNINMAHCFIFYVT